MKETPEEGSEICMGVGLAWGWDLHGDGTCMGVALAWGWHLHGGGTCMGVGHLHGGVALARGGAGTCLGIISLPQIILYTKTPNAQTSALVPIGSPERRSYISGGRPLGVECLRRNKK